MLEKSFSFLLKFFLFASDVRIDFFRRFCCFMLLLLLLLLRNIHKKGEGKSLRREKIFQAKNQHQSHQLTDQANDRKTGKRQKEGRKIKIYLAEQLGKVQNVQTLLYDNKLRIKTMIFNAENFPNFRLTILKQY